MKQSYITCLAILHHLALQMTLACSGFFSSFCSIDISQENYSFCVILNIPDYSSTYCERTFGKSKQIQVQLETVGMNKNKQGIFN